MSAAALIFLLVLAAVISSVTGQIAASIIEMDKKANVTVAALNAVLGVAPQDGDFVILVTERNSKMNDVSELRAPWGLGVFTAEESGNLTQAAVSKLVNKARQLRLVSWSVTVMVVSDDPAFLTTFAKWSLKGRLLVWSTRLLVLTRLPANRLQYLYKTLGVTNSMLLQLDDSTSPRLLMYTVQPYSPPGTKPASLASWSPERGVTKSSSEPYYRNKFAMLSQRPRITVSRVIIQQEKFITIDDPQFPGEEKIVALNAENEMIETIAAAMNFTVRYTPPADGHWGYRESEGVWTGMIGDVFNEDAEIALGLFTMTPERSIAVDFAYPMTVSFARVLAARGSPEVTFLGFLLPLTLEVWVGILLSLGVYVVVMLLPSFLPDESLNRTRLIGGAGNCVRILLQQDVFESSGWWWWERVVLGVWMLMTLVLTRSYAGNLMSLLAVRNIPEPLQTLEDVLATTDTVVLLVAGTAEQQAFRTATSGARKAIWDLGSQGRLISMGSNILSEVTPMLLNNRGKMVQITLEVYQQKRVAAAFTKSGTCSFSLGSGRYIPALEAFAGAKDSPLVPIFSRKVIQITEAGLYNHWQTWFFPNLTTCMNSPTTFAVTTPLAIRNIWGMFLVLIGGYVAAIIAFLLELLYSGRITQ